MRHDASYSQAQQKKQADLPARFKGAGKMGRDCRMTILRIKVFRAGKSFLVHRRHEGSRFVELNVLRPYMAVVYSSLKIQMHCSKAVPKLFRG